VNELLILELLLQFFSIFQFSISKFYFNPLNFIPNSVFAMGFHLSIESIIQVIPSLIKAPFFVVESSRALYTMYCIWRKSRNRKYIVDHSYISLDALKVIKCCY
jgi:hypothetical protein